MVSYDSTYDTLQAMLNIANLDKVLAIVNKSIAGNNIYMPNIQSASSYRLIQGEDIPLTEASFFQKGNRANLMGLIAISDAWRKDAGGTIDIAGEPKRELTVNGEKTTYNPVRCMEDYLGISAITIGILFYGYELEFGHAGRNISKPSLTYNKNWNDIRTADVYRILNELKQNGEIRLLERVRNQINSGSKEVRTYVNGVVLRFDGTLRVLKKEAGLWPPR